MSQEQTVMGIDGCPGGWITARLSGGIIHTEVVHSLEEILGGKSNPALTFLDIPIGLADSVIPRDVEASMRALLKPLRHHSVFTPTCREALEALTYQEAKDINFQVTGKKISIQAHNITPKIRETDTVLRKELSLTDIIHESHPEICFAFLNRGRPMQHSKRSLQGMVERLRVLDHYYDRASEVYRESLTRIPRKLARRDDIIDSICLAISASLAVSDKVSFLRGSHPNDSKGLPIKIAYYHA